MTLKLFEFQEQLMIGNFSIKLTQSENRLILFRWEIW